MTIANVTARFILLTGLSHQEASAWSGLVEDAFDDIERRVKSEYNTEQNSRCLEAAAGALAFYKYKTVLAARAQASSFKAGDISVQANGGVKEAYALFLQSLEPCEGLFEGSDFIFGRMDPLCTET